MSKTNYWVRAFPAALSSAALFSAALTSAALLHAAAAPQRTAEFSAGVQAYIAKDYPSAIQHLTAASRETPLLRDYIAYYLASARDLSADPAGAQRELEHFGTEKTVLSPLGAKAALLSAQALLQLHNPNGAIKILREYYEGLPQPEGDLLLAQSYEAQGERVQAAALYQRVYFLRPATQAAVAAAGAIERLKPQLGKDYPPPPPEQMLTRGDTWLAMKSYVKAKAEFQSLYSQLSGMEKDQAQVRMAAADTLAGDGKGCRASLEKLHFAHSEADAERLYYLAECNRKLNDDGAMNDAVEALGKHYPDSPWRLKALTLAGNRYLLTHDSARYTALYTTAYQKFPADSTTAYAHWKVTWDAYLKRAPNARPLLEAQIRKYPSDTRAASALYFLGRAAEAENDLSAARETYTTLARVFPNYYYGVLAELKLNEKPISSAALQSASTQWLSTVDFPARPDLNNEAATRATTAHIERARLLASAGFPDWAQAELRFGAETDGQKHLLAIEIARQDPTPALALRHMKGLTPEYLSLPIENAPREFWRYLFPMPYRQPLTASAGAQGIDPYLLAGLIRQESEFNPGAVSRANALGLTQLIPGTGRMMARGQGMPSFNSNMLFEPDVSLKLGAAYLKSQITLWNGNLEQTLAAYNAGPGRVREWLTWNSYREPAEFVESIPFTETREYVQAVLRNAAVYRRLYAGKQEEPESKPVIAGAVPPKAAAHRIAIKKTRNTRKKQSRA